MKIYPTNQPNNISAHGLYFVKSVNLPPKKEFQVRELSNEVLKETKFGIKYIEDNNISKSIKEKFYMIPFIKQMAEKFDIFIRYKEMPKYHNDNLGPSNVAMSQISWINPLNTYAEIKEVDGYSLVSEELARQDMFKKLEHWIFNKEL